MPALILSDGKPGHENQSIALCRHLGLDYRIARVAYPGRLAKAVSYLLDRLGIYSEGLFRFPDGRPALGACGLLVSTGSTTFYPNKVLGRRAGLPQVAILHPKGYRLDFTWILCPAYDHPPKRPNVIQLPFNLCAADAGFFADKAAEFRARHPQQGPAVGFIIGGPNAVSTLEPSELRRQLEQAFRLTEGRERWVTSSRRTPREVEALIEALPFDYRLIHSRDPYNPVPAFIGLCERLFVTSDSASMISECASFGGAAVEVLMNRQRRPRNKFVELIEGLERLGAVHRFDDSLGEARRKIDPRPLLQPILAAASRGVG